VDISHLDHAFQSGALTLPPAVVSELLASPRADLAMRDRFFKLPVLPIADGYWHRAGLARSTLLRAGRKARLADALISQSCIDHNVPLITRDNDFHAYAEFCGLKLA
jgi:predicted nucleic acid-binding protein